jgi:pimeloyl-ACP methyl ester carboxylesterase
MLEFERRRMTLSGKTPAEVNETMRKASELYDLYLNRKMTPGAVLKERPDLAAAWSDDPEHQYGRPARYYQQLQALDLEGAWSSVDAPVLAIHGAYDFIMSRADHERIAAIVNARHPGWGRFVEIPGMDHVFGRHPSEVEGMTRMDHGVFAADALETVLAWLKERTGG